MPVDSVRPYTSTSGTPSVRKKRTTSGGIGAAPVSATRARRRPMKFCSERNTSQ